MYLVFLLYSCHNIKFISFYLSYYQYIYILIYFLFNILKKNYYLLFLFDRNSQFKCFFFFYRIFLVTLYIIKNNNNKKKEIKKITIIKKLVYTQYYINIKIKKILYGN